MTEATRGTKAEDSIKKKKKKKKKSQKSRLHEKCVMQKGSGAELIDANLHITRTLCTRASGL